MLKRFTGERERRGTRGARGVAETKRSRGGEEGKPVKENWREGEQVQRHRRAEETERKVNGEEGHGGEADRHFARIRVSYCGRVTDRTEDGAEGKRK